MQTSKFLDNTEMVLNSGGYVDVLAYRMAPYLLNAPAVILLQAAIDAIVSERNNVHTITADGIVDVAPVVVAAAANDGIKLRYICKEMIDAVEGNVKFGAGLAKDETIEWLSIPGPNTVTFEQPELFRSFVKDTTAYGYTANTRTRRAATLAALYALYAGVAAL